MKRLICVLLILLFIPVLSFAEDNLHITISEFIDLYNSVSAPLGSPYVRLKNPDSWDIVGGKRCAVYFADNDQRVAICLFTIDRNADTVSADVQGVMVCSAKEFFPGLICTISRVLTMFIDRSYTLKTSPSLISDVLSEYYENKMSVDDIATIDFYRKTTLSFMMTDYLSSFVIH